MKNKTNDNSKNAKGRKSSVLRRNRGQGSLYFNKRLNKWQGKITIEYKTYTVSDEDYEVCSKKLDELVRVKHECTDIDMYKCTIIDLMKFMNQYKYYSGEIIFSSYQRNCYSIQVIQKCAEAIYSPIATQSLGKLTENDFRRFLPSLRNYSQSVIDKAFIMLKATLNQAVYNGALKKNFLCKESGIKKPKSNVPTKKVHALSVEEQKVLVEELMRELKDSSYANRNYCTQLLIELYTGMRMGEINALTLQDIDMKNMVIHINKSINNGKNHAPVVGNTTKTENGTRDIVMNENCYGVLDYYLKHIRPRSVKSRNVKQLFVTNRTNNTIRTCEVNNAFKRVCQKIGIADANQHMLRHTFVTNCIDAGVKPEIVQKNVGHASIETTFDIYNDVRKSSEKSELQKVNEFYINNGLSVEKFNETKSE